ncbi:MAG: twin-arginine translocase TatA/TatE family subunit [Candidatus Deferrimicrobium sp.]
MFGIGIQEMLVILVVVLIFFGPKRLPDLAKSFGKGIAEFKKASEEVRKGIEDTVKEEPVSETPKPPEHLSAYDNPPGGAPAPKEPAKTELGSTQEVASLGESTTKSASPTDISTSANDTAPDAAPMEPASPAA